MLILIVTKERINEMSVVILPVVVAANASPEAFVIGVAIAIAVVAIWSLVSFIIDIVRNIIRERSRKAYVAKAKADYEANRCYGVTLKGHRCTIAYCSISHKSYLSK